MQEILQYLLKWSIALGVAYIFYRLVLRPLTFYQWNRRYLVLYSVIAFFIPFINITTYVPPAKLQGIRIVKYIPVINISGNQTAPVTAQSNAIDILLIAGLLIATGSIVLLTRLLLQWHSLRRIRRTAVPVYHPQANVYHVDDHVIPFSFGNSIYVNTSLHSERELQDIILHEFVHVRQKHSMDIIWSEVLCILNWYNPFAWLIRHAIRQNLEFIADQAVLNNGLDKKEYQYHLLKVIGSPQYSIANNFNFSSLKKRIAMMNRLKSARVHLVKFLFVLPLLAVLLVAFRNKEGWNKQIKNDTIPEPRILLPDELALHNGRVDHLHLISLKEFYRRNPEVKQIAWSDEDELIVYMKNGRREVYSTEDRDDMKRFVKAYGGIPTIMAAPTPMPDVFEPFPPLAPDAPIVIDDFEVGDIEVPDFDIEIPGFEVEVPDFEFEMPDIDIDIDIEPEIIDLDNDVDEDVMMDIQDDLMDKFYDRNPQVRALIWRDDEIIIRKKDNTVEVYTLSDNKDMKRFKEKYGEPPVAPPPPPHHPKAPVEPGAHRLPDGVKSAELSNNILTLRLADGTKERYDLTNPREKAAVEKKYGKVIRMVDVPKVVEVRNPSSVSTRPPQSDIVVRDKKNDVTLMADQIVVHGSIPNWNLKPVPKPDPVFYVNGKRSSKESFEALAKDNKMFEMEVIGGPAEVVRITGEPERTGVINLITKENANIQSARLTTGVRATETLDETALRNTMYHGIENPIVINAHGIPADELVVTMQGGKITKKNGRFYAVPQVTGNVEIMIYRSTDKGLKLLNKRAFRVRMQPTT